MSIEKMLRNPHDVDISLIIPSINFNLFTNMYNSIVNNCSDSERVELILKLDGLNNLDKFHNLCDNSPFKFKIVTYPQYNSRYSLHHFYNDMGAVSSGKIIWILNDDCTIVHGDWYKALMKTRGIYKDNIYCVVVPFDKDERGRGIVPTPAISREWHKYFGYVTGLPNYDRWLCEIAKATDRRIFLDKSELMVTMPKGRRVLSKQDRKDIFYPKLEEAIKKLKRALKT